MGEKKISKNTAVCGAIFVLYAALTLIGALNHELWFDEAQAWTIARDNTIGGIFHQLGYEGHPPLWYLILYVFSHLGFECTVIPLISWVITLAAAAVVMFRAPFHIVTKAALLFSGGFLYLNSVMSRVYCLINLFAVLIAWLYPKRKEHPVLFGFFIAMLANTHICISGFIGIMGIFMITDLFRGFRTNSPKQNAAEITGLAVSGIGVLTLVLPLLNSLSLNSSTSEMTMSFGYIVDSVLGSFLNIALTAIDYNRQSGIMIGGGMLSYILAGFISALLVVMVILMRHKTRPFMMLIFFCVFYIVTTEVLWTSIPNRALIFVAMFFVIAWIAECEPENKAFDIWSGKSFKVDTNTIRKLIKFIKDSDKNFSRSYLALLTAVLLITVPAGAAYLFNDYTTSFCPSEKTADYIRNNFPGGSVFVTDDEFASFLSAYLPEYKFYSTDYGEFYTYHYHKKLPEDTPYGKIYNDLKDCSNVYYIVAHVEIDFIRSNRDIIYSIREGMPFGVNIRYIEISEFDLDKEIAGFISE